MNEQQRTYCDQGFLLVRGFFDPADVRRVRTDAQDVFVRQLRSRGLLPDRLVTEAEIEAGMARLFHDDRAAFLNCGKVCQHLVHLHRLSLTDALLEQLRALGLDTPVICTRPVVSFHARSLAQSEAYYKTPPHQDWRSMQGSLNAAVVWVPLGDIDRRLGALEVMPGSHRLGLLESEPDEWYRRIPGTRDADYVPVEVQAGDVLFFSAFLVHRSGDNTSDTIRWSCHFRYNDLSEPTYVARSFPSPYLYKPQQDLVTPGFPPRAALERLYPAATVLPAVSFPSPPALSPV